MSDTVSTKPYLIRALYEWCTDNGFTPHLAVKVQSDVRVPMEFARNGEIVLNVAFSATSGLHMDNQAITFKARFGGVSRDIYVPIASVAAIYAKENGEGMAFDVITALANSEDVNQKTQSDSSPVNLAVTNDEKNPAKTDKDTKENRKKPSLTVIK